MYDITDKSSFDSIPDWIGSIKEVKGNDFPMILLGNKIDKEDERVVSQEEGKKLADKYKIEFFETSNKNGTNIDEAGLAIVNKILDKERSNSLLGNNNINSGSFYATKENIKAKSYKQKDYKKCC
jgi:GTPase SAR1 family protein